MLMNFFVDVLTVHDVTTPACQLFNYLLGHGKAYNMEVFRMVPVPAGALNDSDCGEYDTDSEVILQFLNVQGPFERFIDWQQCTAVMQREVVTVMPSCSGGGNIAVA